MLKQRISGASNFAFVVYVREGSYLVDARVMTEEEVNCLSEKCPQEKKNCNSSSPLAPTMETTALCYEDNDCNKYCPKECNSSRPCVCACNGGQCFCQC
ncbi:unnamed protein product [Brassica napus]|uniref:(rape) hypothetical protein n=1 Tax=Brassica napus TaxID=3708 RepID=A0A816QI58_BRANA|nr:unnamed protein product [Brassica napus]